MSQALVLSGTITYGYDSEGHRNSQKQGSTLTNYLWDEGSTYGDVLLETNGTGTMGASYTLADGAVLAQTTSTGIRYLLHDKQGSTRAVSGTSGSISESHVYDAYGSLRDASGTPGTMYLYTGQQFDAATKLYSLRARYYNPAQGRFTARDTAEYNLQNPIELNRYGYTANNPITRIDPLGLFWGETAVLENPQGKVEAAAVEAFGKTVLTAISIITSAVLIHEADLVWQQVRDRLNNPDDTNFAIVVALAETQGHHKLFISLSDFYPGSSDMRGTFASSAARLYLISLVGVNRFRGGDFEPSVFLAQHAEDNMLELLRSTPELHDPQIVLGAASQSICIRCQFRAAQIQRYDPIGVLSLVRGGIDLFIAGVGLDRDGTRWP